MSMQLVYTDLSFCRLASSADFGLESLAEMESRMLKMIFCSQQRPAVLERRYRHEK